MKEDVITGEVFLRVVGRRARPPIGQAPTAEAQAAHASLQQYRTRAPKGIFRYRNHEEMEADRLRWTVDAMVHRAKAAAPAPVGRASVATGDPGALPPSSTSEPEGQDG